MILPNVVCKLSIVRVNFFFGMLLDSFGVVDIKPFCFIQRIVLKYLQYNFPLGHLLILSLIKYTS